MSESKKVISVKKWSSRLAGKPSAKALRTKCENMLSPNYALIINMAGVKDMTPGFAQECFGKLYVEAKQLGYELKFSYLDNDEIAKTLMKGIQAEKSPRY